MGCDLFHNVKKKWKIIEFPHGGAGSGVGRGKAGRGKERRGGAKNDFG